ncbi:hypothetical protein PFICI_10604 [Pestalotiopsis fici W106-1]|uniref:Glycoside hydrolase family 39 protein n=1 Tax=Pestalotiopsis fici (strain W106-1 / CGMCC3.15140) TaxID=1229662 RepID=W3WZH3_PESFW|nr:uncharacterized protein PFICI_10604 [Pestalotiopsis fici W106-1]ETS78542.1 hypothetical protein PFICI_10604 [Pestalotiopsis fici W106-1]
MKFTVSALLCLVASSQVAALGTPVRRSLGTATVSLGAAIGTPSQLGSGILYGIPPNDDGSASTQIPDHFYTDIGFNLGRAGGAAWGSPNRGWSFSPAEYTYRFQVTLSNYRTTRQHGGDFYLLPHDLWGIDTDGKPYPGDDGDWIYYDQFLDQLISDIKANSMTDGLIIDIWNEPDASGLFWRRTQAQYLEMWGRTYYRLRQDLPSVSLSGPATSCGPADNNPTFTGWAEFVAQNGSIPDIYTWHALNPALSPSTDASYFASLRSSLGLPSKPICINEYLAYAEEGPGPVTYYLSQFERLGISGVKANWAKGEANAFALHNYLANILGPEGATSDYYGNGEFQLYKYYASMSGERVATTPSSDGVFEVFATRNPVKMITAARLSTDSYTVTVTGFAAAGFTGTTVTKHAYGFEWDGVFGEVDGTVDFGTEVHTVSGDAISFDVYPRSVNEAYAFEFS